MQPIHELLSRIRWDRQFADAAFVLGYYDRVEHRVLLVAVEDIIFPPDDHFAFEIYDDEGVCHAIPLHRVVQVYRNGELIWQRNR